MYLVAFILRFLSQGSLSYFSRIFPPPSTPASPIACLRFLHGQPFTAKTKTKLLVFPHKLWSLWMGSICFDNVTLHCVELAHSLTFIFDPSLSLIPHIQSTTKTYYFFLYNIVNTQTFLPVSPAKSLVHALEIFFNYCNLLLSGLHYHTYNPSFICRTMLPKLSTSVTTQTAPSLLTSLYGLQVHAYS